MKYHKLLRSEIVRPDCYVVYLSDSLIGLFLMSYKYHGKRPPISEINWIIQGKSSRSKGQF